MLPIPREEYGESPIDAMMGDPNYLASVAVSCDLAGEFFDIDLSKPIGPGNPCYVAHNPKEQKRLNGLLAQESHLDMLMAESGPGF